MTIRLVRFFVCLLLAASAAQAQLTTSHVNVLVTGARCGELREVFLVVNENDLEDRWIRLEPAGACRWKADLGQGSISTANARFSLRADLARTDCHKAAVPEENLVATKEPLAAELEFACCRSTPMREVRVTTTPSMPVSYLREVKPFAEARSPGVPCLETGSFAVGTGSIRRAQFGSEKVYLQLGADKADRKALGLLLNDITADGMQTFTLDRVVYRLIVQRAQGKVRTPPTLSSNAIVIDAKKLGELKFERAEIEVKP